METGSTDKQAFINCLKFYANFLTALNINSPKNAKRGEKMITRKMSLGSKERLKTGASCPRNVFCWLQSITSTILTRKSLRTKRVMYINKCPCKRLSKAMTQIFQKHKSKVRHFFVETCEIWHPYLITYLLVLLYKDAIKT